MPRTNDQGRPRTMVSGPLALARTMKRRAWDMKMDRRDRSLIAAFQAKRGLLINVGASSSYLDDWINCDLLRDPEGRCLQMDATERWPFADGSARAVNSEHVIEHFTGESDLDTFLAEAFRVLDGQGVIRLSTPDLGGLCREYVRADPTSLAIHRTHGYAARTHGEMVNNYFYLWDHRHLYDLETISLHLEKAGFEQIEGASFGQSRHEDLRGIDRHDPEGLGALVLVVDAVRPA